MFYTFGSDFVKFVERYRVHGLAYSFCMHKQNGSSNIRKYVGRRARLTFVRPLSSERFQVDGCSLCKLYATRMYGWCDLKLRRRCISSCLGWANLCMRAGPVMTHYSVPAPTLVQPYTYSYRSTPTNRPGTSRKHLSSSVRRADELRLRTG